MTPLECFLGQHRILSSYFCRVKHCLCGILSKDCQFLSSVESILKSRQFCANSRLGNYLVFPFDIELHVQRLWFLFLFGTIGKRKLKILIKKSNISSTRIIKNKNRLLLVKKKDG